MSSEGRVERVDDMRRSEEKRRDEETVNLTSTMDDSEEHQP